MFIIISSCSFASTNSFDFYSADKGRLHLTITDNLCQITVSNAMKKDNGRWNLYVGVGSDFFERKNIIYEVSVLGNLKCNNIRSASMAYYITLMNIDKILSYNLLFLRK